MKLTLCLFALTICSGLFVAVSGHGSESFGYVPVRKNANMFWWLMRAGNGPTDYLKYPLVIWLQGGPGGSSTGFGNFLEIGPLYSDLSVRNNTWLNYANLLFIDNPVGAGYSYVTSDDAYVTNNDQIADDLLVLVKEFYKNNPEFKTIPLSIFCESYGGKMTATFAVKLAQAIKNGELEADFKSIALGDSWISPEDSTASWSNYLYTLSLIDEVQKKEIDIYNWKIRTALKKKKGVQATDLWRRLEDRIEEMTAGVNWYNILQGNSPAVAMSNKLHKSANWALARHPNARSIYRHVTYFNDGYNDALDELMNGKIKEKLGIPESVIWGSQSGQVFEKLAGDFMNPVIHDVDTLLNSTNVKVVVYTGQLDLIVDTVGTEQWINELQWHGLNDFKKQKKELFATKGGLEGGQAAAFVKKHKNFALYWILQAGHMVPTDQLDVSVQMLKDVLQD